MGRGVRPGRRGACGLGGHAGSQRVGHAGWCGRRRWRTGALRRVREPRRRVADGRDPRPLLRDARAHRRRHFRGRAGRVLFHAGTRRRDARPGRAEHDRGFGDGERRRPLGHRHGVPDGPLPLRRRRAAGQRRDRAGRLCRDRLWQRRRGDHRDRQRRHLRHAVRRRLRLLLRPQPRLRRCRTPGEGRR